MGDGTDDRALVLLDGLLRELSKQFQAVTIQRRRRGLYLQATLPHPTEPGKRKQGRISLKVAAVMGNLTAAEDAARKLERQLATNTYDPHEWSAEVLDPTFKTDVFGGLSMEGLSWHIEKLYEEKCPGVPRNSTTAWGKKYQPAIRVFEKLRGPCSEPLLLTAIRDIESKSSRKSIASIVRQTVKANGFDINVEKITDAGAGYVAESINPRTIPDDELIESLIDPDWLPHWHYLYGMCWLFGIRGHEIVGSEMEKRNGGWVLYVPHATKTGFRECWACPGKKVEMYLWDKPVLPPQSKLKVAKIAADYFSHTKQGRPGQPSRPARIPFPLYNLRHAYAIRLLARNVSAIRAAKLMGHTLKVHEATYHRWITKKHMAEMHTQEVELFR